jgi:hypothetical protein
MWYKQSLVGLLKSVLPVFEWVILNHSIIEYHGSGKKGIVGRPFDKLRVTISF